MRTHEFPHNQIIILLQQCFTATCGLVISGIMRTTQRNDKLSNISQDHSWTSYAINNNGKEETGWKDMYRIAVLQCEIQCLEAFFTFWYIAKKLLFWLQNWFNRGLPFDFITKSTDTKSHGWSSLVSPHKLKQFHWIMRHFFKMLCQQINRSENLFGGGKKINTPFRQTQWVVSGWNNPPQPTSGNSRSRQKRYSYHWNW